MSQHAAIAPPDAEAVLEALYGLIVADGLSTLVRGGEIALREFENALADDGSVRIRCLRPTHPGGERANWWNIRRPVFQVVLETRRKGAAKGDKPQYRLEIVMGAVVPLIVDKKPVASMVLPFWLESFTNSQYDDSDGTYFLTLYFRTQLQ
jgi:hypothetical protein